MEWVNKFIVIKKFGMTIIMYTVCNHRNVGSTGYQSLLSCGYKILQTYT